MLVFVGALASLLESFGLTSVFVFLGLLVDTSSEKFATLQRFVPAVATDHQAFLVFICLLIIGLYVVKVAVQIVLAWLRLMVEWRIRRDLGDLLFTFYLRSPYPALLRRTTSQVLNNIAINIGQLSVSAISIVDLVNEIGLFVFVTATLFYLEPAATAILSVTLGIAAVAYISIGKQYFVRWGRKSVDVSGRLYATVTDPLVGIKQVKVMGIEDFFVDLFKVQQNTLGAVSRKSLFVGQCIKPILELAIVVCLMTPVVIYLQRGLSIAEMVPILAIFAAASYRLLPGVMRLTYVLQNLQFSRPAIDAVAPDIAEARGFNARAGRHVHAPIPKSWAELRLDRVSFAYDGSRQPALKDVSLAIRRGSSIAIVGPSGAGKTTLVDVVLGLLPPTSGSIKLDNTPLATDTHQRLFGYVPQENFLMNDTIRRNVALGIPPAEIDDAKVLRALDAASLGTFVRSLPNGIETQVGERGVGLSGGQRQRIAIARTLYHDAEILVFDESTSSLDASTEASVSEATHALKGTKTTITITHRLTTVKDCDELFYFEDGKLVDHGSFGDLHERNEAFRATARQMEMIEPATVGTEV